MNGFKKEFLRSDLDMLYDVRTSGRLLLAVNPERADDILKYIRNKGFEKAEIIK